MIPAVWGLDGAAAQQLTGPKTLHGIVNGEPTQVIIEGFISFEGQLFAIAALPEAREVPWTGDVLQRLLVPAIARQGETCQIVNLRLALLDLDLFGLMILISTAEIQISAESNPMLGDRLCTIAHLLDSGDVEAATTLLNRIWSAVN